MSPSRTWPNITRMCSNGCCRTSSIGRWRWCDVRMGCQGKCFFQRNWVQTHAQGDRQGRGGRWEKRAARRRPRSGRRSFRSCRSAYWKFTPGIARPSDIEHPDQMIFDLDPGPDVPWKQIDRGGPQVSSRCSHSLKLPTFLKTTGGKGIAPDDSDRAQHRLELRQGILRDDRDALAEKSDCLSPTCEKTSAAGKSTSTSTATAISPPPSPRIQPAAAQAHRVDADLVGGAGKTQIGSAVHGEKRRRVSWPSAAKIRGPSLRSRGSICANRCREDPPHRRCSWLVQSGKARSRSDSSTFPFNWKWPCTKKASIFT